LDSNNAPTFKRLYEVAEDVEKQKKFIKQFIPGNIDSPTLREALDASEPDGPGSEIWERMGIWG
jgi:hypothetical protein